ncbi:MAG: YjjG family noncanonical pyrimidine nucleotidase [Spirochaetales bacterium]|nr:YjjG family noncanonical pyrimidine nucleotidase [Spirochaetales bacterium]
MNRYKYLLIDADGTFLDFEKTEHKALNKLMDRANWQDRDYFVRTYANSNRKAWNLYEDGQIPSDQINNQRFTGLYSGLQKVGEPEMNAQEMGEFYLSQLCKGDFLIEGTLDFFEYLKKDYILILATNGLADVQYARIKRAGVEKYFDTVAISQELGAYKPMAEYYEKAMAPYDYKKEEVLMIGDSLKTDMAGAEAFGIDSCWFNPGETLNDGKVSPTYEIARLDEIQSLL